MSRWFDDPLPPPPRRLADLPTSGRVPGLYQQRAFALAREFGVAIIHMTGARTSIYRFLDGGMREAPVAIPGYPVGVRWAGHEALLLLLARLGIDATEELGCEDLPDPADIVRKATAVRERDGLREMIACGIALPPVPGPDGPLPPRDRSSEPRPRSVPKPTEAQVEARRAAGRRWTRVLLVAAPLAALALWLWGWWGLPPALLALHAFVASTWHRDSAARMQVLLEQADKHPELLRC